jgi:hypothetical protein
VYLLTLNMPAGLPSSKKSVMKVCQRLCNETSHAVQNVGHANSTSKTSPIRTATATTGMLAVFSRFLRFSQQLVKGASRGAQSAPDKLQASKGTHYRQILHA